VIDNAFGTAGVLDVAGTRYAVHRVAGIAPADLPYSLRILLECLLRNDSPAEQVRAVLEWGAPGSFERVVDVRPARVFLHDTNGVPALVDLAAMRDAAAGFGVDPALVNPSVVAELTVDHSVGADVFGRPDALSRNVALEYRRNAERYRFLRWGQAALRRLTVVPPGNGIMHQINLERLARVVVVEDGRAFPDLCLGTDSHTTMVNGLGVLGWGIGGIEAEAAMLGQSLPMTVPPVVGVRLHGSLPATATATDLVLTITNLLRAHGVVGRFVEFHGPGVTGLSVADRATVANMSPEFGSTCGYFPVDEETLRYLRCTGRPAEHVALVEAYAKEQGIWHDPARPPRYTEVVELDLATVLPSIAGPRRPQDLIRLDEARAAFRTALGDRPSTGAALDHGAVAIAAITSCTNTSNPTVMVTAGLLARNAVLRGLRGRPWVKTTLSPGSRVVTDYLDKAGLTPYLEDLGFHLTGYGCMTCIGASGPLVAEAATAVEHDVAVTAVLSGNRNFDSRIHPQVGMNYLASPPLVIAYALAGTMDVDLLTEPLGHDRDGLPVRLRDVWPDRAEVRRLVEDVVDPAMFTDAYRDLLTGDERWLALDTPDSATFEWDPASTYVRRPPYLDGMPREPAPVGDLTGARVLAVLGDSVTTDHISPAGAIPDDSPAGRYLAGLGVPRAEVNTYASRRGNHEVLTRATFANVRLRNALVPDVVGGYTRDFTEGGEVRPIYEAAMAYRAAGVPQVVLAGREYGTGSSRDWAAKGPALLGVRAVIARSFERIHRANLVGMGVLPLQFADGDSVRSLGLTGEETISVTGLSTLEDVVVHADGASFRVIVRLDTPREVLYWRHGGIMRYVLRKLLDRSSSR
jgi:aconitate hydratase